MKRDKAILDLSIYTKNITLNQKTILKGLCSCGKEFNKSFANCFKKGGMFCKSCVMIVTLKKMKDTNIKIRGVENPGQSLEVQEKRKQTNLRVRGVENPAQSSEVQEKMKQTNLRVRGVKNPSLSLEVQEKRKQTNLRVRGVENPGQSLEVQEKMKQTNLRVRGVEYSLESLEVQEKRKQTNLRVRGVENPGQSPEVQEKMKQTNLRVRGVEYSMQDPIVAEKVCKGYRRKLYTMPSGDIRYVQGYEPFALNLLTKNISEKDIITSKQDVPEIWYELDNVKHRHYVDIYIPSINKCIEVKSKWTFDTYNKNVLAKQQAAKDMGYDYEIWIFDKNKQLISTIV
jgi:hypothetical protein